MTFPYTYLGLQLSVGKSTKEVLLPLVDKVAVYLPMEGFSFEDGRAVSVSEGGADCYPYISFNSHGPSEMGSQSY